MHPPSSSGHPHIPSTVPHTPSPHTSTSGTGRPCRPQQVWDLHYKKDNLHHVVYSSEQKYTDMHLGKQKVLDIEWKEMTILNKHVENIFFIYQIILKHS